ncbi:srs domain-containing protein [Cystoisospora suis]|uniref:Srs domain-containing protein n=1 Tax=Cystoisospora suis TaxID=483139 RepID=A0A2C6LHC1_9APIC|nr:srs domain-containing protein [Cystoisospora suis]
MNFLCVCLLSSVAALRIPSESSAAGANIWKSTLSEEGTRPLQADPRRLSEEKTVTCKEAAAVAAPDRTATFSETKLEASFTCGGAYVTGLIPDKTETAQCLQIPTENTPTDIATVLGVQGKVSSTDQKFTVTLAKIPDEKRGHKIYYKCKNASDKDTCLVTLELPSKIGPTECAIDRVLKISLGKASPSINFKCAGGSMNPKPFEVGDGTCSTTPKVSNAVQVTDVDKQAGEFKATVGQHPNQAEQLCYTCTYANVPTLDGKHKDRTCSVIVTVEAAASSTSTVTTTSSARSILSTCGGMNILIAVFLAVGGFN